MPAGLQHGQQLVLLASSRWTGQSLATTQGYQWRLICAVCKMCVPGTATATVSSEDANTHLQDVQSRVADDADSLCHLSTRDAALKVVIVPQPHLLYGCEPTGLVAHIIQAATPLGPPLASRGVGTAPNPVAASIHNWVFEAFKPQISIISRAGSLPQCCSAAGIDPGVKGPLVQQQCPVKQRG